MGLFQLCAVLVGLVLQCPGHLLQVCLQAVKNMGRVTVGGAGTLREKGLGGPEEGREGPGWGEHSAGGQNGEVLEGHNLKRVRELKKGRTVRRQGWGGG